VCTSNHFVVANHRGRGTSGPGVFRIQEVGELIETLIPATFSGFWVDPLKMDFGQRFEVAV
jgi:hypothetical protein